MTKSERFLGFNESDSCRVLHYQSNKPMRNIMETELVPCVPVSELKEHKKKIVNVIKDLEGKDSELYMCVLVALDELTSRLGLFDDDEDLKEKLRLWDLANAVAKEKKAVGLK